MRSPSERRGSVLTMTLLMMVGLFGFLALTVDLGYMKVVSTELQRTADAAAIAATRRLIDEQSLPGQTARTGFPQTTATASLFTQANLVGCQVPVLASSDTTIGQLTYPPTPTSELSLLSPANYNAVKVRVRRTSDQNGTISLFFARMLGIPTMEMEAEATAMFVNSIKGFRTPANGGNLNILPFALDLETWNGLLAGVGSDDYKYNEVTRAVCSCQPDGVLEVNLYPKGNGSPGNRGTVDIGPSNNSTNDICRQILHGISAADLQAIGGTLELGADGTCTLNGDTGISAGVKDELEAIKGQPRIIPIFSSVVGPGNNATYTIVAFVGVRIVAVKLTGSNKYVMIQPAPVVATGAIPGSSPTSQAAYTPVFLVR